MDTQAGARLYGYSQYVDLVGGVETDEIKAGRPRLLRKNPRNTCCWMGARPPLVGQMTRYLGAR